MPAVPVCLFGPIWEQFSVLLPARPSVVPTHPLGCHRRRIPDRVVFEHVVAALVHGSGYERIASPGCSDRTIRRRVKAWAEAGCAQALHRLVVAQYDRMIGLDLDDVVVDGCITKAPCGGEKAGRSPVDRGKQGLKRSTLSDGTGIPLHIVSAGANRNDLDRGYDSAGTREVLTGLALTGVIARKGVPAPLQVGKRWVVERTHAWMNGYGKLRRCTERNGLVVDLYLFLAAAFVITRRLIQRARKRYRWDTQPTTRRLK
jgi:hypothetical protein